MTFVALCLSLPIADAASAQTSVTDPIPLLNGTVKAKLLYSIPYVVSSATIATCVSCTRTDKSTATDLELIGVELFEDGSRENHLESGEGVVALLEGGDTAIVCTENAASVAQDSFISPDAQDNEGGTGRIVGTTKSVMCTAFLVSVAGDPPTFMTILPMYKGSRQKGGM
jgi:hypothetical protein